MDPFSDPRRDPKRAAEYSRSNGRRTKQEQSDNRTNDEQNDQNIDNTYGLRFGPFDCDEAEANAHNGETFGANADIQTNGHMDQPINGLPFDQTPTLVNGDAGTTATIDWQSSQNGYVTEARPPLRPILKTPPKQEWELVYSTAPGGPNAFRNFNSNPGPSRPTHSSGSVWYNQFALDTQRFNRIDGMSPRARERHVHFDDIDNPRSNNVNDNGNSFGLNNIGQMANSLPQLSDLEFEPLLSRRSESNNSENEPPRSQNGYGNIRSNLSEIFERTSNVCRQEDDYMWSQWNRNAERYRSNWNNNPLPNPFLNDSIWSPATNATGRLFSFFNSDEGPSKVLRFINEFRKTVPKTPANYTWSGQLPRKSRNKTPIYSCKVFLGGIPYDLTDSDLHCTFAQFGHIHIQWPGKDIRSAIDGAAANKAGYVYIIFESYDNVAALLNACTVSYRDMDTGPKYYYNISSRRQKGKEVQVIPFDIGDRFYMKNSFSGQMEHSRTVFVGACHGMLSADGLAKVMDDLFGGVIFAGLDTDKYKYPLGSARVSFDNQESYMKAISAAFVEIKSARFKKKIQIDPYIENEMNCVYCGVQQASPIFCRDHFEYFCPKCWDENHSDPETSKHRPIIKNRPTNT